eukprot:TRINITY_DN5655_c0_g1_i2.p1 TRINITY_DN5655_c0_g1~~TRINITY_DN5655_c0_g1_i2.p1  ORF type:complete len:238 (-),score=60.77 TRINITY_DN5655_c0_g1_i2:221-934(-)
MAEMAACSKPFPDQIGEGPHLIYVPFSGRAELCRLIAAAGGVNMTSNSDNMANFGTPVVAETGESKADYMSTTSLPLLKHGDLKLSQTMAIETYLANISPRYSGLTLQCKAVDGMYQGIKEDICAGTVKAMLETKASDEAKAKEDIIACFDKYLGLVEPNVPAADFIQGLGFPTIADLAVLDMTTGYLPFGAAAKFASYDFNKWPKIKALNDRTKADAKVAEYLKVSPYPSANPLGL